MWCSPSPLTSTHNYSMSEAEENLERGDLDGKRRFKNGDPCPWNKSLVCWGYKEHDVWWVSWGEYSQMCKRHKINPKKIRRYSNKAMINPNKLQKKLITKFWNYFIGSNENRGGNKAKIVAIKSNADYGLKTEDERLQKLKEYADIIIPYNNCNSLLKKRDEFNKRKDTIHSPYHPNNSLCFVCRGKAECRHHIIQLQNGGINSRKNLVSLCNGCHSKIHPWLK
jgi:HNH endonuclease